MEFTQHEKSWIKELIEEEYAKQKEQGHVFDVDREAFENIIRKIEEDN